MSAMEDLLDMNEPIETGEANEINERLRRRYLDRLAQRVRKIRKQLIERDWSGLRVECVHLKETGASFGFPRIAELAAEATREIPAGHVSRLRSIPEARNAVTLLVSTIDAALSDNGILRLT
jgi:hypothetical protein